MLSDKIHIVNISVSAISDTIGFRLTLPKDLVRITGFAFSENTKLPVSTYQQQDLIRPSDKFYGAIKVGDLLLRERGESDAFFASEIKRSDHSLQYGDFAELDFYNKSFPSTLASLYNYNWPKAGAINDKIDFSLYPSSRQLQGFYRDYFNAYFGVASTYWVKLYIFYEPNFKVKVCERN